MSAEAQHEPEAQQEEDKLGRITDWPIVRRLLSYLRPYKWRVAAAVALLLVHSVVQTGIPLFFMAVVDIYFELPGGGGAPGKLDWVAGYLSADPATGLMQLTFLFGLFILVGFLVGYGQTYLMMMTGQYVMYDLRMRLFRHLQRLEVAYFDRNPVGRLVTRLTNDVDVLNEIFTAGVVAIFGDALMLILIVVIMVTINWKLALLSFAVLPLIGLVSVLFRNFVRSCYRRQRVALASLNSFLQEHLSGMTVVQLFNRERRAAEKFGEINRENRDAWRDAIFAHALFYPLVEFLSIFGTVLIVWYWGYQYITLTVSVGTIASFLMYVRQFFRPIQDLSEKYNILQSALASSERIFRVLDTPAAVTSPERPDSLPARAGRVEFRNVWFAYKPGEWVLEDISFTIEPGEMAAIVGHTGAGKTTVTNLLLRFYDVQKGEILIDGVDVRKLNLQDLRSRFAMVLQDPFLFSGTLASNVRLGTKEIGDEQVTRALETVNLGAFVNSLPEGVNHEVRERGATLSVGQKQLLSFARSLAHDPEILILDEATSSVDTQTEHLIQEALERLIEGRSSIVVAHRLSTIQRADRILVFHKGKLREQGNHQELLAQRGLYYKLYQLQYRDQEVGVLADDD